MSAGRADMRAAARATDDLVHRPDRVGLSTRGPRLGRRPSSAPLRLPGAGAGVRQRVPTWASLSAPARVVAFVAVLSAALAVVLARHLFPYLSIDNDEPLYRLQAQVIAQGHLFPPAPTPTGSYAPWLAAVVDGHYVLKYTPTVPAIYALSMLLTGGTSCALAILAAALIVTTYLLGCEALADRRTAAVATVLVAASPLVVVQSALLLPYVPFVVLLELAVLGLLRGLRRGRPAALAGSGLAAGLAFSVRPFDAVLFLGPLAGWMVWTQRGRLLQFGGMLGAGAAVPLAALFAFDAAATGKPLRMPFALLEPQDSLGFGVRRLYPSDDPHSFGVGEGLAGVGQHLWLLGGWACGGVVLALLSVAVVVRGRAGAATRAIAAGGLLLAIGYIGFWGAWNAALHWRGTTRVGPFYLLPLIVPTALLGARGLVDLARWRRVAGGAVAVAGAAVSVMVLAGALPADANFTRGDRQLARMIQSQAPRPAVLIAADPPFLMHPSAVLSNPPRLDGQVLYAVSRGADDFAVLAGHPGRPGYLLRISGLWNVPGERGSVRLERLKVVHGAVVRLRLLAAAPRGATGLRVTMSEQGRSLSYALDPTRTAATYLRVGSDGATIEGAGRPSTQPPEAAAAQRGAPPPGAVEVVLTGADRAGERQRVLDRQVLPVVHAGNGIYVLAPQRQVGLVGDGPPPPLQLLSG